MSEKEKTVKHIFKFWSISGDVFTFYILTIGVLTLYAFSCERELLEVLNLTITYQFFRELFCIYVIIKGILSLIQIQPVEVLAWMVCSFAAFTYLSVVSNDISKIMAGFTACFVMKMLIIVYVKIRKYSTECIGEGRS